MKILLFSNFELPCSCANASRVFSFAQIFKELKFEVKITGICYRDNVPLKGIYKNFPYEMIQAEQYFGIKAIKRIHNLALNISRYLEKEYTEIPFDAILLSNFYYDYSKMFLKFSKKYNVPLIVNAVEWYDTNNSLFSGTFGKILLFQNRIALRYIHVKMNNIIAISSFLGNYYKQKKCNTIVVPTILDKEEYIGLKHMKNKKILISYAGSPGKKDYITNIIYALSYLNENEIEKLELHFYGITQEDLMRQGFDKDMLYKYSRIVFCHGKIHHDSVKNKIAESDFTVLLRPDKRYANAGFPTKVGESMVCGTPVIANITSDLSQYIINGSTGIVCQDERIVSCALALKKALAIKPEEYEKMRYATHLMAEKSFDYRVYLDIFKNFFHTLN